MKPAIITIALSLPAILFMGCGNADPNLKVIKVVGDHAIVQHFNHGKMDMEGMAKPAGNGKYTPDGYCKIFDDSGRLKILGFARNKDMDSARNTYTYTNSGKLGHISHNGITVDVLGYHEHESPWRSDLFHTFLFPQKTPDSVVMIRCNFRSFRNVSARLALSILRNNKPWFDTAYDMTEPVKTDDFPEASIVFRKRIAGPGDFVCVTRYTLTDYPSGIFVTEDTNMIPLIFH